MNIRALFVSVLDNLFTEVLINVYARNKLCIKAECIE
jgi:hypothetical protein